MTARDQADTESTLDAGVALDYVLATIAAAKPARIIVIIEDPGAANFAAGMLAELSPGREVSMYASGAGADQLACLGHDALPLAQPFDPAAMLMRERPHLAVIGTSENPAAMAHGLVEACRAAGVPTLGIVDGPANTMRRFRGGGDSPLAYAPDWVMVPAACTGDAFAAAGFARERILVVAHPHLVNVAACAVEFEREGRPAMKARLFPGAGARKVVVFLAERSDGLDNAQFRRAADYTLCGRCGDWRRTSIVLEEVLDVVARFDARPYFALRLHPRNTPDEFAAYRAEIDQVSRTENALEVVYAADVVVGLTTILLSEAAVLGRPALSVVPRAAEREWLLDPPGARLRCVWERSDVTTVLAGMLMAATPDPMKVRQGV